MAEKYYWCLTHSRVETEDGRDDPDSALGPYDSPEAAQDWKATNEARNDQWEADDRAWEGEDDQPG